MPAICTLIINLRTSEQKLERLLLSKNSSIAFTGSQKPSICFLSPFLLGALNFHSSAALLRIGVMMQLKKRKENERKD